MGHDALNVMIGPRRPSPARSRLEWERENDKRTDAFARPSTALSGEVRPEPDALKFPAVDAGKIGLYQPERPTAIKA